MNSNQIDYKNKKLEKAAAKRRAFEMMHDGAPLRLIEKETGIARGTLSRWRRSNAFAVWSAEMSSPVLEEAKKVASKPVPALGRVMADEPRSREEVRGQFLFAVKLGGLQWAQNFSGATDKETAAFLRDTEVLAADSRARLSILNVLRGICLDKDAPRAVRAKTSVDYLKIIDAGLGTSPLIHIDARSQAPGQPSDHIRVMLEALLEDDPPNEHVLEAELLADDTAES